MSANTEIQASSAANIEMAHVRSPTPSSPDKEATKAPSFDITEHLMSFEEVATNFESKLNVEEPLKSEGLSSSEAEARLLKNGKNEITPPKRTPLIIKYLHALSGIFNVMLLVSGILAFILYAIDSSDNSNIVLGVILIVVSLLNAFIEFFQQYKTESILEGFKSLIPGKCMVIRDGVQVEIFAIDVVTGDILIVRLGDKLPADVRLVVSNEIKVDNSSITGESEPQERSVKAHNIKNPLEASCLLFSGTLIVQGEGCGIVIRTGDKTMLGQIAGLTCAEKAGQSQLSREIDIFVKKMGVIAFVTAIVFFVAGLIIGYSLSENFGFAIGVFTAFVPQGLPATVTTLLTIAAKRMARINVLVKDLHGVETLGSITLLATDKTGTLTMNKMTVVGSWLNNILYFAGDAADHHEDEILLKESTPNLNTLLMACSLCSRSKFDEADKDKPLEQRKIFGDATETGLLRFAAGQTEVDSLNEKYKKIFEIPFSSATKWHLTIHDIAEKWVTSAGEFSDENSNYTILLKGAPERIVKMCKWFLVEDKITPWSETATSQFGTAYEHFARQGQRVLAFAKCPLPSDKYPKDFRFAKSPEVNFPTDEFIFIGLIALIDPPKKGVRKAVASCRTAGIQVVMVTGDHPLTATAIGRKIGLITGETKTDVAIKLRKPIQMVSSEEYDSVVIHGDTIDALTENEWDEALSKREIIFARTSPKHKLAIVTRFQAKGHIVGVSGDGVNDAPALKKADLGISMNKSASDVSKEAAGMILLDDNFASIVNGISEGRLIFSNLKKSIRYTLAHIFPEIAPFLIHIIFGIPLPLSSFLVLLIDLGTEMGPAVSFAWEPQESDLMMFPPRKVLCTEKLNNATYDQEIAGENETNPKTRTARIVSYMRRKYRKFFTRNETGEVLIDNDLLIWSYFEAGVSITIGCFAAYLLALSLKSVPFDILYKTIYFDSDSPPLQLNNGEIADAQRQLDIQGSAQGAYFFGIVIGQWFTLFLVKHRYSYPYGWDLLKNRVSLYGILVGAIVASIVVYVPAFNDLLDTAPVGILPILMPLGTGILFYGYEFVRRYLRFKGYFGGVPKKNTNLLELVRTTSTQRSYSTQ